MKVVCFYTGQGVVGKLSEIGFYTGQFSTCSPVVMFNENTTMCGVYHLPGKNGNRGKLTADMDNVLIPMLSLVDPTIIYTFPSGDAAMQDDYGVTSMASKFGDRNLLSVMFEDHANIHGLKYKIETTKQGRTGIYVWGQGKKINFDTALPTTGVETWDLAKKKSEPPGCTVINMDIDYSLWIQ